MLGWESMKTWFLYHNNSEGNDYGRLNRAMSFGVYPYYKAYFKQRDKRVPNTEVTGLFIGWVCPSHHFLLVPLKILTLSQKDDHF